MIKKISKYRDAIMGIAILWIMLHHSGLNLPRPFFDIKRLGYCGVELFMFCSGMGCAVSLSKNKDTISFYKRRIIRIFPHYIPVLIAFLVLNSEDLGIIEWIKNILGNITCFSYWTMQGLNFNWYIPMIFALYLLTPIFYEILITTKKRGGILLLILSLIAMFCFTATSLRTGVSRIPIYLLGMMAGIQLINEKNGSLPSASQQPSEKRKGSILLPIAIILMGLAGSASLLLLYKYQKSIPETLYNVFFPCIFVSLMLLFLSSNLFELLDKAKVGKAIITVLSFLGKISLDLYLVHIVFFKKIGNFFEGSYDSKIPKTFSLSNFGLWVGISIGIIIISFLYNILIDKMSTLAQKRSKA